MLLGWETRVFDTAHGGTGPVASSDVMTRHEGRFQWGYDGSMNQSNLVTIGGPWEYTSVDPRERSPGLLGPGYEIKGGVDLYRVGVVGGRGDPTRRIVLVVGVKPLRL